MAHQIGIRKFTQDQASSSMKMRLIGTTAKDLTTITSLGKVSPSSNRSGWIPNILENGGTGMFHGI